MSARQRTWAKRKRRELIEILGGKCSDPACSTPEADLEIDHVNGRTWEPRKYELSWRISRYWQEYRDGVELRVLCKSCNSSGRNKPSRKEQYTNEPTTF